MAQRGPQTSDGVRGPIAPYVPQGLRPPPVITSDVTWPVVPGVTFRQWEQVDTRGPIRASLLTLDLATTPGLEIDYASSNRVSTLDTVRRLIAPDGAIAGINGDFYDIQRHRRAARPRASTGGEGCCTPASSAGTAPS